MIPQSLRNARRTACYRAHFPAVDRQRQPPTPAAGNAAGKSQAARPAMPSGLRTCTGGANSGSADPMTAICADRRTIRGRASSGCFGGAVPVLSRRHQPHYPGPAVPLRHERRRMSGHRAGAAGPGADAGPGRPTRRALPPGHHRCDPLPGQGRYPGPGPWTGYLRSQMRSGPRAMKPLASARDHPRARSRRGERPGKPLAAAVIAADREEIGKANQPRAAVQDDTCGEVFAVVKGQHQHGRVARSARRAGACGAVSPAGRRIQ